MIRRKPIKQLPLRASKNEKFLTDFMSEKNSTYERTKTTKPESNSKTNPDTESQTLTKFIWHHEFQLIFINYPLNKLYIIKKFIHNLNQAYFTRMYRKQVMSFQLCLFSYVFSNYIISEFLELSINLFATAFFAGSKGDFLVFNVIIGDSLL